MARVFLARLRGLGGFEKQLVIKQIKPELARDPKFVDLFVREANTLVALSHPHIVQVYELGAAEGTYYLSMEYVEGATIARILEDGPLAAALSAHIASQICEALDYAHSRFGILHRDITPRNIIVDRAGHARLLDFGIATQLSEHATELFGSPGYMSPEQAAGEVLGPRSDMFSLGAVLFEMLTRDSAFEGRGRTLRTQASLAAALQAVPAPLSSLVCTLLEQASDARPAAPDVARNLRAFLAQTRPEGVLAEMQLRAEKAADKDRLDRAARQRAMTHAASAAPLAHTARVEAQSIATSPVLTELIRSASGLSPMPTPPAPSMPLAAEAPAPEAATRRIREAKVDSGPDFAARATRFMFKAWPSLAVFSMVLAFSLSYWRSAERQTSQPATRAEAEVLEAPLAPPAVPTDALPPSVAPAKTAPQAPAPEASDSDEPKGPDESRRANLSINAQPWAEVSLDGKALGTTPIRNLKVRAGLHRLRLHCPPLGRSAELSVTIDPLAEARIVVDLQENPPRTFLDGAKEVR